VAGAVALDCTIEEAEEIWNGSIARHFLRATA
jgi:hypothetical protein